jgi:hypothetical protein
VQEDKVLLRCYELQLKQRQQVQKNSSRQSESQTHSGENNIKDIPSDHLGPNIGSLTDLLKRTRQQFGTNVPPDAPPAADRFPAYPPEPSVLGKSEALSNDKPRDEESTETRSATEVTNIVSLPSATAEQQLSPVAGSLQSPQASGELDLNESNVGPSEEVRLYRQTEKNLDETLPATRVPSPAVKSEPSAVKSSPELYRQGEKNPDPKESPQCKIENAVPRSVQIKTCSSDLCSMLNERTEQKLAAPGPKLPAILVAHAIKRWRFFLPRSEGAPLPDNSWKDECPCGKALPCEAHGDLWKRVSWYRPQNISYKQELESEGLLYYIPSAGELGCSQEILKQSIDPFAFNPQIKDAVNPYVDPFNGKLNSPAA